MITATERELHGIILRRHVAGEVMPSYDEMADALGLRSKSGVAKAVASLEAHGLIRRLPNRARAIEPTGAMPSQAERLAKARDALAAVSARPAPAGTMPADRPASAGVVSVPVAGPASGGVPHVHSGSVDVAAGMLGAGEHVAVVAEGNAMLGAGILAGDYAILGRDAPARDGDIVLATVEGGRSMLGRYRESAGGVGTVVSVPLGHGAPEPTPALSVLGRVVGMIRHAQPAFA